MAVAGRHAGEVRRPLARANRQSRCSPVLEHEVLSGSISPPLDDRNGLSIGSPGSPPQSGAHGLGNQLGEGWWAWVAFTVVLVIGIVVTGIAASRTAGGAPGDRFHIQTSLNVPTSNHTSVRNAAFAASTSGRRQHPRRAEDDLNRTVGVGRKLYPLSEPVDEECRHLVGSDDKMTASRRARSTLRPGAGAAGVPKQPPE
jgi:hypothetical protein